MAKTIPSVDYDLTEKNLLVDSRLKICIECGHDKVEYYEFGLSCEICGVLHIFDPEKILQNKLVVET